MTKLVVMVSIYESGEWIENRLKNLLNSSMLDEMDIWCVNANSPDPLDHEIPLSYSDCHPITYVKLDERITVYETWNYIIENSSSQFITNANTDDLIHPQGYEKLTNVLHQLGPKTGFAYPSWLTTGTANQTWNQLGDADRSGRPGNYAGDIQLAGVGHFPLWRRKLHEEVGLFDTKFRALADADWWARCSHIAKTEFKWVDEYLGCYLWRDGDNLWHRECNGEEWNLYHQKVKAYRSGKLE